MKSLDLVGFFGFAVQLAYSAPLPLPTNELELIQTSAAAIIPYSSYSSATTPSPALIESLSFDGPIPPDVIDRDFADDATEDYVALQINHTDKSSPNNTESTSLFLPSSDNYHNLHSEVEGDDRNNVKDFKFHTHLGCCRKLLICGGCSSGLLQPKPKAFASYNPILRFLNILIIFVLTLLSDPHVDWHNSTAILSALKSPDLFSAVCAEPGADEKMAVIEGILQNVSRLTEAKNQVDKLSIAKNWTEDMLGNAIFNGVLLVIVEPLFLSDHSIILPFYLFFKFPRQCSQQEAENVIRIAKTTKCSRQICIDPPASGFCGEFTVPDPSTDVAHTALQDLMDSVLKTCNVDSKSLFPGVTDFVLGLLGIPSIEVPCPEWKEVDVNFVITAMQQTTVVQKCVTPPSPQCTNISLPCPPDALIAKMASLDEFHKTMSIQIKNIVSGLGVKNTRLMCKVCCDLCFEPSFIRLPFKMPLKLPSQTSSKMFKLSSQCITGISLHLFFLPNRSCHMELEQAYRDGSCSKSLAFRKSCLLLSVLFS